MSDDEYIKSSLRLGDGEDVAKEEELVDEDRPFDKAYTQTAVGELLMRKARRYISDPSDAPEGVNVEQGPQGGYYYETDSGEGASSVPGEGASEPAQEAVAEAVVNGRLEDSLSRDESVELADYLAENLPDELPEGGESSTVYSELNEWANERGVAENFSMDEFEQFAEDIADAWDSNDGNADVRDEPVDIEGVEVEGVNVTEGTTFEWESGKPVTVEGVYEDEDGVVQVSISDEETDATSVTADDIEEQLQAGNLQVEDEAEMDTGGSAEGSPDEGDGENLWDAELETNYDEGDSISVDTDRAGEITGTIADGASEFFEYGELVVQDEQGREHVIPTDEIEGLEHR